MSLLLSLYVGRNCSRNVLSKRHILWSDCRRNLRGALRRLPTATRTSQVNDNNIEIPTKIIEQVEEKVDLKQYGQHLSATARLALKANPDLLRDMNSSIRVDENGDMCIKSYKFASNTAASKFNEFKVNGEKEKGNTNSDRVFIYVGKGSGFSHRCAAYADFPLNQQMLKLN